MAGTPAPENPICPGAALLPVAIGVVAPVEMMPCCPAVPRVIGWVAKMELAAVPVTVEAPELSAGEPAIELLPL